VGARAVELGAGEILLTSMDRDGTKDGFDTELTRAITDAVDVPVIASGGVGTLEHLVEGVTEGGADAVLAASIFHFGEHTVAEAKGTTQEIATEIARCGRRRLGSLGGRRRPHAETVPLAVDSHPGRRPAGDRRSMRGWRHRRRRGSRSTSAASRSRCTWSMGRVPAGYEVGHVKTNTASPAYGYLARGDGAHARQPMA
jgi:hypothetical protein